MADTESPNLLRYNGAGDNELQSTKRSYKACKRCHAQKVKCSGQEPCRNCQQAKKPAECVYPVKDRKVHVSQSYLQRLEEENKSLKRKRSVEPQSLNSPDVPLQQPEADRPLVSEKLVSSSSQPSVEPQIFLSDEAPIQPMFLGEASSETFGNRLHQFIRREDVYPSPRPYVYYKNQKLLRIVSTDCQLPNKNYGRLLVRAVLRFIGGDHHLLLRKSFIQRLDETYRLETLDDPVWLCQLFTVFALGELYSARTVANIEKGPGVPGTGFFLRAMGLFRDMHEEPTVSYIETLLLLSFYSIALNRRNTALTYAGLAVRLSMTLGLHRYIPANSGLKAPEREHRIRVWWSAYALDRIYTSKVGLPCSFRDEDIDVQMPSMDGLTPLEAEDFYTPELMTAQIKLARITGNIMNDLYRIPQPGRANTFVQSVQRVLTSLRSWHETLPTVLRLDPAAMPIYSSRSVASLHLHFGNAVILTTRPILFHVFRSRFALQSLSSSAPSTTISPMTTALAEACVQAARNSNSILAQLWVDGCLAPFGFFDALSVFSSTIILMMSSALKDSENRGTDDDAIETAWTLLRSMRDAGNLPASGYLEQMIELKADLDELQTRNHLLRVVDLPGDVGEGTETTATDTMNSRRWVRGTDTTNDADFTQDGMSFDVSNGAVAVLDDPFLQNFLQQPYESWQAELPSIDSDPGRGFTFDWEDANVF